MRIAVIGLRGVPASYCGIDAAVEELGSRMVALGHDVTVFCVSGRYPKPHQKTYRGMHLQYVPSIENKNLEILIYSFLATLRGLFGSYDVYHLHQNASPMALLLRLFGKKTVCTIHRQDWKVSKWSKIAKAYLKFGEWAALNVANETTVVSETLQEIYKKDYGKETIHIPNGASVPEPVDLGEARQTFGLEERRYILYVGQLRREKNVPLLVSAFRDVKTTMKLVVVGGEESVTIDELKQLAGPDQRIVLTGALYGDPIKCLFSNAFLFVLPSDLEGLPIATLEALSYGNAVLVSDVPENVEVIKEGDRLYGYTFSAGDLDSLTTALQQLVDDPEGVAEMRKQALPYLRRTYSWERAAEETLEAYGASGSAMVETPSNAPSQ